MNRTLVLCILSDDRPGIVEALAKTISQHDGNWLDSRLSHMAGKFAGILQVNLPESQAEPLQQALQALKISGGIQVISSEASERSAGGDQKVLHFSLVGNDRPGIVRELSQALASHQINLDDLQTSCSSMPFTGDAMFSARGVLQIPAAVDIDRLQEQLDAIADQLDVEIDLLEASSDLVQ
ncbi:glycine cleavage system protein R [Pseudomaricurvus sp. HS19]|uniref:glycine cleavage system protein R n=1 Tax=Pseudomaricurvus sp. HS19 TaxID=2692626 RepID=UPI00136CBAF5|nr:ACT domain-containing protein [Pseudomaricurvus sp. HS19]MYM61979.1 cellulose-binding protein [Pseudomaricurvus sp. HS19]